MLTKSGGVLELLSLPLPEYTEITSYSDPHEISLNELEALNPDYRSEWAEYDDAAIVVVGRPGGENGYGYLPGEEGLAEGVETQTGNILSLSAEEKELVEEAKANFDKVIVLINAVNPMEISDLADDPEIDSIMWIGFPGAYGFLSLVDVLTGDVAPSGHLGDVLVKNSAAAPAIANIGDIPWTNAADFPEDAMVNSYLIEAEGIYTGYRYYETRYADHVMGNGGEQASAGTYANVDGTLATVPGTWDYENEVVYPLGYGLSYTTFEQTLDSAEVKGDKKTASVAVTVKNTGAVAGKASVQVYAQVPYTDYDKQHGVEKSAIQLMDFEKSKLLEPGESQTITMELDLSLLASFDAFGAGTYILDPGEYYLSVAEDSHAALNNILAAQDKQTSDGMNDVGDSANVYQWTWDGEIDSETFAVSANGTEIVPVLSDGDYATDYNAFEPGTVTYLTRSDWDGTFPTTYAGIAANEQLSRLLRNDLTPLSTDDDVSELVWGDTASDLTLADMKGADYDDPRWGELIDKVTIDEYLNFAANAFHNIEAIPSAGLVQMGADDGPNGHMGMIGDGQYQGVPFADGADYSTYGVAVTPAPVNLAYTWNKELAFEHGEIVLGEAALSAGKVIMIGPALNLQRHAYNSRAVEYYSEDPILSGYIASAVTQGAESMGTIVNVKHLAFNDQEINRSGIAVFLSEQAARELELRNFQQTFEAGGIPASFVDDQEKADLYQKGASGVMTSFNRIGAVAPSANAGVMVNILRDEWGFNGYNVTDFTNVSLKAAPKESVIAGTTAFCGFGVDDSITYWNQAALINDQQIGLAIKDNLHDLFYVIANSAGMNGVNSTTHAVDQMTWWRVTYIAIISIGGLLVALGVGGYAGAEVRDSKSRRKDK
ncbi:glycoside hydrolase family 3 C-terminal domain-containing protein [Actinomycetaceae bacterium MB13-C1-2]|nr:glycoside hydrolase family 3 C-terminal domain-containing protein [Actinomycetaceae bacterium MB13-C1-2]